MNKGLKALNRIKNALFNRNEETQIIKDIDFFIIEKELNEYQQIQEHFNKYKKDIQNSEGLTDLDLILMLIHNGWWFEVKGQKIKKALEIIKDKFIDVGRLVGCIVAYRDEKTPIHYNERINKRYKTFMLSQEEYDLLKEVLL